jgi:hypothetical protein
MPAIIGALQEFVEQGGERLRHEAEAACRERQKEEREALERLFLSGADCKWTPTSRQTKSDEFAAAPAGKLPVHAKALPLKRAA